METISKITCPQCGHHFNAEQALAQEVEDKLRLEYNQKFKGLQAKIQQERLEEEQSFKKRLEAQLDQERKLMVAHLKDQIKKESEQELSSIKEELEQRRKEQFAFKSKEIAFMKKEQAFTEQMQALELEKQKEMLELQKQMFEKQKHIEEEAKRKADEQSQLKMREYEKQLEDQKKLIAEMQRKSEQGSMQLQGEVQELALEEMLKAAFPFDRIEEVGKGIRGADVIQTVRNPMGRECGKIIYESKRTKTFSEGWIDKLKIDLRGQKAEIAVIVSECLPKEMDRFGMRDGIWVCTFQEAKVVSFILRDTLIKIYEARSAQENRGDKMQLLYDYLTRDEFRRQVEAIVEGFVCMQKALNKERIVTQKIWKEREKQLEKVLQNTVDMYGSIKGIAGSAVADIKQLEHPDLLLEDGNE